MHNTPKVKVDELPDQILFLQAKNKNLRLITEAQS